MIDAIITTVQPDKNNYQNISLGPNPTYGQDLGVQYGVGYSFPAPRSPWTCPGDIKVQYGVDHSFPIHHNKRKSSETFQLPLYIKNVDPSSLYDYLPSRIQNAGNLFIRPKHPSAHGHSGSIISFGNTSDSSALDMLNGARTYGAHGSNLEKLTNIIMGRHHREHERNMFGEPTREGFRVVERLRQPVDKIYPFKTKGITNFRKKQEGFCHAPPQYETLTNGYKVKNGWMPPVR